MFTVQDLINHYPAVVQLLKDNGFMSARIFKGFNKREEHNFNLVFEDQHTFSDQPRSLPERKLALKDGLSKLFKCKMVLTEHREMDNYYFNKLNNANSVMLTAHIPQQELENIFGKTWSFTALESESNATLWSSPLPQQATEDKKYIEQIKMAVIEKLKELPPSIDPNEFISQIRDELAQNREQPTSPHSLQAGS